MTELVVLRCVVAAFAGCLAAVAIVWVGGWYVSRGVVNHQDVVRNGLQTYRDQMFWEDGVFYGYSASQDPGTSRVNVLQRAYERKRKASDMTHENEAKLSVYRKA